MPDSMGGVVPSYAFLDLPPIDGYMSRSLYSQSDVASSNAHDLDLDIFTDHYGLTKLT